MRLSLVIATSITALALPAAAGAHGRGPAMAVDEHVSIDARPRGVEARVLDGDRSLWLRVARGVRVVVLGSLGEPLLRRGHGGVWANRASPTAAADGVVASGRGWSRVAGGRSFPGTTTVSRPLAAEGRSRRSPRAPSAPRRSWPGSPPP